MWAAFSEAVPPPLRHHVFTPLSLRDVTGRPAPLTAARCVSPPPPRSGLPPRLPAPRTTLQKNKVKSKITRHETRVNKCRKTPNITGIIRRFVVSVSATVANATRE